MDPRDPQTESQSQTTILNPPPRIYKSKCYIINRILIVCLGSFCYGYTWTLFNNLFHELSRQFTWANNSEDRNWYHGLINCLYLSGALCGSLFAFTLSRMSRIKQFILTDCLMITGGMLIIIMEIHCILLGRFCQGTFFFL
jgi:MFS family permease